MNAPTIDELGIPRKCPECSEVTPDFMQHSTIHAGDCAAVRCEDDEA